MADALHDSKTQVKCMVLWWNQHSSCKKDPVRKQLKTGARGSGVNADSLSENVLGFSGNKT